MTTTPTSDWLTVRLPAGLDRRLREAVQERGESLSAVVTAMVERIANGEVPIDDRAGRAPRQIAVRIDRERVEAAKAAVRDASADAWVDRVTLTDVLLPMIEEYLARRVLTEDQVDEAIRFADGASAAGGHLPVGASEDDNDIRAALRGEITFDEAVDRTAKRVTGTNHERSI